MLYELEQIVCSPALFSFEDQPAALDFQYQESLQQYTKQVERDLGDIKTGHLFRIMI